MAKYDADDPPGMIPVPFGIFCSDMYLSTYCMTIHLALLAPGVGFFLVFLLWLSNKDRHSSIDRHGKAAVNWLLSCLLYAIVTLVVSFYYQPISNVFMILIVAYYLFPIIAATKAHDEKYWNYPLSIPFFKN